MGSRRRGPTAKASRRPARPGDPRGAPVATAAKPSKAERMAEQRRARRRRTFRNRVIVGVLVASAVGLLAVKSLNDRRESTRLIARLTGGSCEFDRRSDGGSTHVVSPSFRVDPPSGGDHTAAVAPAGVFSEGDVPGDGEIVHAMEHGYVVLWHGPGATEAQRDVLDDVATRFERDVLVVPRPSMETPVAATAWHRRLLCGAAEPDVLTRFTDEYRNDGPERVPH